MDLCIQHNLACIWALGKKVIHQKHLKLLDCVYVSVGQGGVVVVVVGGGGNTTTSPFLSTYLSNKIKYTKISKEVLKKRSQLCFTIHIIKKSRDTSFSFFFFVECFCFFFFLSSLHYTWEKFPETLCSFTL